MDKRVYYLFLFVFVLAAGSFSFRYANYKPCTDVNFAYDNLEAKAGSVIQFQDKTVGASEWEWDFGDGSARKTQKNELHVFEKEGTYEVRLQVDNGCELTQIITVGPQIKAVDSTKLPEFYLPNSIIVGKPLVVRSRSENAESWEWRFGETIRANASTEIAEYVYRKPGIYTVSLVINGKIDLQQQKRIEVKPVRKVEEWIPANPGGSGQSSIILAEAPETRQAQETEVVEEPMSEKEKIPELKVSPSEAKIEPATPKLETEKEISRPPLDDTIIEESLQMLSLGKMSPEEFSAYFCEDKNPFVMIRGESVTFKEYCRITRRRKIMIDKVTYGENRVCIESFEVLFNR